MEYIKFLYSQNIQLQQLRQYLVIFNKQSMYLKYENEVVVSSLAQPSRGCRRTHPMPPKKQRNIFKWYVVQSMAILCSLCSTW